MLLKILVCFFAGMGAGLGTGFAGMSAAAVISPMLITFLGVPAYEAVGIALASDVLASAVSAYTYGKHKNLDIKNGLVMMVTVLLFTLVGELMLPSLLPDTTMGGFFYGDDTAFRYQVYCPACDDDEGDYGRCGAEETFYPIGYLRYNGWFYLRIYRRRRRYDDAADINLCAWL